MDEPTITFRRTKHQLAAVTEAHDRCERDLSRVKEELRVSRTRLHALRSEHSQALRQLDENSGNKTTAMSCKNDVSGILVRYLVREGESRTGF